MSERDDHERWLSDELTDEERRRLEEQALRDPERAESLYADLSLQSSLEETARGSGRRGGPIRLPAPRWRWRIGMGAVAAVLAVLVLRPVLFPADPDRPPAWRGGDRPTLTLVSPSGRVESFPRRFVWRPAEGASLYRFELYDAQARRRAAVVVADTLLTRAPSSTPTDSTGRWRWLVVPILEDGSEAATSAALRFTVEEDPGAP